jgi:hypothetical protein
MIIKKEKNKPEIIGLPVFRVTLFINKKCIEYLNVGCYGHKFLKAPGFAVK